MYRVPPFQRDYSWTADEWDDLWQDILGLFGEDAEPAHYMGYLDPVTLVAQSKLTLNRHNDRFYQNYLVPLEHMPQRGLNASEHLLRKVFIWCNYSAPLGFCSLARSEKHRIRSIWVICEDSSIAATPLEGKSQGVLSSYYLV